MYLWMNSYALDIQFVFWKVDWIVASETAIVQALGVEEPTSTQAPKGRREFPSQIKMEMCPGMAGVIAIPQHDIDVNDDVFDESSVGGGTKKCIEEMKALAPCSFEITDEGHAEGI